MNTRAKGQTYEALALEYLIEQGARPICVNYHCRLGEIDLIVTLDEFVVFCEVKYRAQQNQGRAVEQVTPVKQKRLIRTAEHFLLLHPQYQQHPCRFDVIGFDQQQLEWIPNAFQITR